MPRRRLPHGKASILWGFSTNILVASSLCWLIGSQPVLTHAKSVSILTIRPPTKWSFQSPKSVELSQRLSVHPAIKCFDAVDLVTAIENRGGPTNVPQEIRIEIKPYTDANGIGFSLYWKDNYQSERILQAIPKKCREQLAFVAVALIVAIDNVIPPEKKLDLEFDQESKKAAPPPRIGKRPSNRASGVQSSATSRQSKQNRKPEIRKSPSTAKTATSQVPKNDRNNKNSTPNNNKASSNSQKERQSRKQERTIRRQQRQLLRQQQKLIKKQLRLGRTPPRIKDAWIYTGGLVSYGLLPQFSGGAQLDVDINWWIPLNLHTGLLFNHGTRQKVGHGRADITLAAAELALCAIAKEGRIQANFCLAAASGPVIARGISFDENRLDLLPWVSASGQIRLRIDFSSRWGVLVHSAVYMPIVRLRLVIDGESQTKISFPRLGGLISVGPTFRFAK